MSSLEKYQPPQIAEVDQWAQKLYDSGMFSDVKSVAQAAVKIAAGAEMGLTPFQSMSGVHIIQSKPVVGAGLLAALLDRDPAYDYSVEWEPSEANPTACTVIVVKNGKERGRSHFSLDKAKAAGLAGGNWQKYPGAMLFARAMSQAVRWYAPGATGTSVYVEGELTTDVEVDIPNGVTAKPRTRVTAEVIPDPVEAVEPSDVELDYDPVTLGTVSSQLRALSQQERADLYGYCDIEKGTKAGDVAAILIGKADEFGLPYSEPPDVRAILDRARIIRMREVTSSDAVDAFAHYAQTGQDLDADPQTALA